MINPGDAIDQIVAALQAIPELVAAIGGEGNIIGYHPEWPKQMFFEQALNDLKPSQIYVRWLGTVPGSARENRVWSHSFGLYQKPPDTSAELTSAGHYAALVAMINGIPEIAGNVSRMINFSPLTSFDPMDVPRLSIYTDPALHLDYFFVAFTFPEIGDN